MSIDRFMMVSIAAYAFMLTGCETLTKRSPAGPSPLVKASCPELTPLTDESFGATTSKLVEVALQYRECRTAALAGEPSK